MNAAQRKALLLEFEAYVKAMGAFPYKETNFSDLMETKRRFRADYQFTHPKYAHDVIVEINGGQWTGGRHNRGGKGYEADLYKSNLAQFHGFKYYQFTYEMLARQEYKEFI